jgi:WD40 repeat protein
VAVVLCAALVLGGGAGGQTPKKSATGVNALAFAPDGKRQAVGGDTGVGVWDVGTGKQLAQCLGQGRWVTALCFSPDGKRLASAAGDGDIKVWDAAVGKELVAFAGHPRVVVALAFLADGQQLVSVSGWRPWLALSPRETVKVWDAASGKALRTFAVPGYAVGAVAFSAEGKRLAGVSHDGELQMWDVVAGKQVWTAAARPGVCFSPDGRMLATCGDGGAVLLWETQTGQQRLRLATGPNASGRLAFSTDGRHLALVGARAVEEPTGLLRSESLVKVWDVFGGKEVLAVQGAEQCHAVAFGRALSALARGGYGAVYLGKD